MSGNPDTIYIFTEDTLKERDLEIAVKVTQATSLHVVRKMNRMGPGGQLRAGTKKGREEMMLSDDVLTSIIGTVKKN